MGNPLRDPQDRRLPRIPEPCALVIFGVTGDLARKKLIPASYDLANRGMLPPSFVVLGFARRDWGDGDFEALAKQAAQDHARTPWKEEVWARAAGNIKFVSGAFDDDAAFDQPNVAESKENTKRILASGLPAEEPTFHEEGVAVFGPRRAGLEDALHTFLMEIAPSGYLAIMAYLDRFADAEVAALRPRLAAATGRPVTFGWGPRFLHSTGQYHKGGPANGRYLQITGAVAEDLPIPGQPYTFGLLQAAQAAGDRVALSQRAVGGVLRLHLTDRRAGITQLLEVSP